METTVKIIHFVWLQGRQNMATTFPVLDQYVQTWPQHFPDWEIKFWDHNAVLTLLESLPKGAEFVSAFNRLPNFGAQSDLARYAIVYAMGGMYVDTDMECVRNFSCLLQLPDKRLFLTYNDEFLNLEKLYAPHSNNHWFYCPYALYHGLWNLLISILESSSQKQGIDWTVHVTGPFAFSKMADACDDVGYISWHLLEAKNVINCKNRYAGKEAFPCAYAIHHCGRNWLPASYTLRLRNLGMTIYSTVRENLFVLSFVLIGICVVLMCVIVSMASKQRSRTN